MRPHGDLRWVLALIADAGLVKGERIGVDASTMEANAALRNIVRRDTGEGYRGMLARLAQEGGIEGNPPEDLARLDRKRKGKKLSNQDWCLEERPRGQDRQDEGRHDPSGLQARARGGSGHRRGGGRRATPCRSGGRLDDAGRRRWRRPRKISRRWTRHRRPKTLAECVTDKGYHSRSVLKALADGPWKTRISEPKQKGFARWHGDGAARRASPTTGPGCYRAWPRKPSSCAPRSSSAPLRTTSIAAACAGHGCAGARKRPAPSRASDLLLANMSGAGHNLSLLMRKSDRRQMVHRNRLRA